MHSARLSLLGGKNSKGEFASSQLNELIQQFSNNNNTRGLKRCVSAMSNKQQSKYSNFILNFTFRQLSATQRYPQPSIPQIPQQFLKHPTVPQGPQFSFGTQRRALSFSEVISPGPAAYIQSARAPIYKQPPSYAMRAKIKDILVQKEKNSVPGVGNYSFGSSLIKVGTVFGKAKKKINETVKKNDTISSASYNFQDVFKRLRSANPAYSIPKTKKLLITEIISQDKMRKTPGPGAYETNNKQGQCYSFGNRLPGMLDTYCKPRILVPGPGGYEIIRKANEGKKSESYVFGTQEKFKKIKMSPGPGDYNIGRNYPSKYKQIDN